MTYLKWIEWQIESMWPRKEHLNFCTIELFAGVITNCGKQLEYLRRMR